MTRPDWRATYRLQLHAGFGFDDALAILPYLRRLGVSHVYASPISAARPGSAHGYDVTDPTQINPELGGEAGFRRFSDGLRAAGMGLLLDIVPNHMAAHRTNPWWMSMLVGGRESPAAAIFDVGWDRHPQVLMPVLGDTLAETLAHGAITLQVDAADGWLVACAYGEHAWPLCVDDTVRVLDAAGLADAAQVWREDHSAGRDTARAVLRGLGEADTKRVQDILAMEDLPALIERQHWRPVHWRSGRDALSARRFFNVNELVGVRAEDETVFALTHRLPLTLLHEGRIDGLRIDHIDGLADPAGYCRRLRAEAGPDALLVVEKILGKDEELRRDWPVDGTTGYERLNMINRAFVAPEGYDRLAHHLATEGWVTGDPSTRLAETKRQVLEESFAPELEQLTELAQAIAGPDPAVEFAAPTLRSALSALLIHCPVYRSYLRGADPAPADLALWETMLAAAQDQADPWIAAAAGWLAETILRGEGAPAAVLRRRFQQLTGPLMAKGLEDTEFYRNVALLSVNEVGGHLEEPGVSVAAFHAWAARRAAERPRDLTPLATHDTKRGAEVRARLNLLSLEPEGWIETVTRWQQMNDPLHPADGPDRADEWLIYQTLVGAWPIGVDRLSEYLTKAMREAKRHTRWEHPQEAYEGAVLGFATALLESPEAALFRGELEACVERLTVATRINALAQVVLHLTLPGIPDIYQGTEWWDFSLVDPDNRRPVDYRLREAATGSPPSVEQDEMGVTKQCAVQRLLELRARRPELFEGYEAVDLRPDDGSWIGYTRGNGRLLVAVPVRGKGLPDGGLPVAPGGWHDVLADRPFEPDRRLRGTPLVLVRVQ